MSDVLTKLVVDCSTGAVEQLPLTAEEIAQREAASAAFAAEQAERTAAEEAVAAAKESAQAKLAALGLSADEIAALSK
jgi:3-oxoacyl-[acyl-carrier-protein] synthase III